MRLDYALLGASLLTSASSVAIGGPQKRDLIDLGSQQDQSRLFKRKGGGGGGVGGGGGGRGGGSAGGSGSTGGGSRGGSGGGSGGGSASWVFLGNSVPPPSSDKPRAKPRVPRRGNTLPGSNNGGTSRGGTGPSRGFGGGRFYGGGGATPFRAGRASPAGIAPFLLVGGALAFWPGVWLAGAHMYPYSYTHRFHNATTDRDETAKVLCACAEHAVCGCDENNNTAFYNELIGNGSYAALNKSLVNVGEFRGSKTLLINGTLPNGTTADGADQESAAGLGMGDLGRVAGFWPLIATVVATIFLA